MPNRGPRRKQSRSIPDAPPDPDQPAADRVPARRRGGQELPDDVQDRPEQNAGYDAAVGGHSTATPQTTVDDWVERDGGLTIRRIPDELPGEERPVDNADDRAEREVTAEIRRRERRSR